MYRSQEETLFVESINQFFDKEINPYVDSWEENHNFPSSVFETLASAGYTGILLKEKDGGLNLGYRYAALWSEAFGRVPSLGFTTGFNMHSLVITPTLARYGSIVAKEAWLNKAISGQAIGAYAFTEPDSGSDLTGIKTKAVKSGDHYILNGSKIFITNGKRASFVLVFARTSNDKSNKAFSTFLVDTSLPGFNVSRTLDKLGWYSSDTAELVFEDVHVHKDFLLGAEGDGWKQAMSSLEWERLMLSCLSLGGINECIKSTISYANDRLVFGKPVSSYQANKDILLSFKAKLLLARNMIYQAADKLDKGEYCRKEVSHIKRFLCEDAFTMANFCLQLHGGYGYTTEYPPARWLRDLRLNTIGGGTTQIMERVLVKEIY